MVPEERPVLRLVQTDIPVLPVAKQDSVDHLRAATVFVSLRAANVSNVSLVYDRHRRVEWTLRKLGCSPCRVADDEPKDNFDSMIGRRNASMVTFSCGGNSF